MSFKLKSPYTVDWTPIYRTLDEDGVLGLANKNGTIRIHKDVSGDQMRETIEHEKCHIEDIKKGLLWYDNDNMYTRESTSKPWTTIKRSEKMDGNPNLPHEKRANKKMKQNG